MDEPVMDRSAGHMPVMRNISTVRMPAVSKEATDDVRGSVPARPGAG